MIKNLLLIDSDCRILHLSQTVEGTVHDRKLAESCRYPLPEGSDLLQDLGLQGFELMGVDTLMPFKKPRKRDLTPYEKAFNRIISQSRVWIEHVIASIKRCRSVKESLRLAGEQAADAVMEIACGLHNFRIRNYPWKPIPLRDW
jgi:hypothetical protein